MQGRPIRGGWRRPGGCKGPDAGWRSGLRLPSVIGSSKDLQCWTKTRSWRSDENAWIAKSSPQAFRPQAKAVRASRSTSITARPVTALSVDRETSNKNRDRKIALFVAGRRQIRIVPRPVASRSTRDRTVASRSRSSPSGWPGSTTRRGRSASNCRFTARIRRRARGSAHGKIRCPGRLHVADQHPAIVRQIAFAAHVPFRIGVFGGQALAMDVLRRQIEMQFQPRRRRLGDLSQRDLVLVVGRLLGVVGFVIVHLAVQVQELRPGQDRLEAVQDQAVRRSASSDLSRRARWTPVAATLGVAFGPAVRRRFRLSVSGRRSGHSGTGRNGR